jgi:peptidoglycan/LPS O-acetylase OafA/YrhL
MLDGMRAAAVGLVIGNHLPVNDQSPTWLALLSRGGWIGVDLFFVLSGFLVSGLLFHQYQQTGSAQVGRFLIRRAFKIYPAFWFLMGFTLLVWYFFGWQPTGEIMWWSIVSEFTFIQNYGRRIWNHTWSLAVEEHFYIGVAILVWSLTRWHRRQSSPVTDPFRAIPILFLLVSLGCLAARLYHLGEPYDFFLQMGLTHQRIDSLFFGLLLSYWFHFYPDWLLPMVQRWRIPWLIVAGLLFLPPFLLDRHRHSWLVAIWPTCLYLASGAVLLSLVTSPIVVPRWFAKIGMYSYSIYLWHMPVIAWLVPWMHRTWPASAYPWITAAAVVGSTIVLGIFFSKLIEYPVLALRDRWFPDRR